MSARALEKIRYYEQQYRLVNATAFRPQRLLNVGESALLRVMEDCIEEINARRRTHYRVMAQTCMGEIMSAPEPAWSAINCKRLDLLVIDRRGYPALAVEYQGSGHNRGADSKVRNAVKHSALASAKIALLEVPAKYDEQWVWGAVGKRLKR